MQYLWTVCIICLFPITVWYFISFKKMSLLLESKYPEKWEALGKVGYIYNNSLSNSNKARFQIISATFMERCRRGSQLLKVVRS
ncbi:hypothetical protein, partial [Shewanella xiamenensis]|uniref:hypothetical protein n=1 Tax=Shewanella xiamenensis TaxID=332186 RepID=UPI0021C165FC